MSVYLGIDLGTTGIKSLLVRSDGAILGSGYREYPILIPTAGAAEQNPDDWWNGLVQSLREALAQASLPRDAIKGISLSGQMHGTVPLGADEKPLCPAILWCDQRSAGQVASIRARVGDANLAKWTQNPVATGFQISSLLWLRENRPKLYDRIKRVLLPKDYIRLRLTGNVGTEPTDACSTLMFDCAARDWSEPMLRTFDIDRAILPPTAASPMEICGALTKEAADALGLMPGIPVAYGGGDQPMQAIGNGILAPGDASITLGTGGQIFVPMSAPKADPLLRLHTFCHADTNTWYAMGAILNCCLAQNWFANKILSSHDYAALHAEAAHVAPGANGLLFLPYLTGERTPHLNPEARGMYFGLTLEHDAASMMRATIEGISFALKEAMQCIQTLNVPIHRLFVSGGGARSPLWTQILADMLNCPIHATKMTEEAGIGAAICAMVGASEYADLNEACKAIVRCNDRAVLPNPQNVAFYDERFSLFRDVYHANAPLFPRGKTTSEAMQ